LNQPLTLGAEAEVELAAHDVFARFGAGDTAGWLFDAKCDRLAVGSTVRLKIPLQERGGQELEILGRFVRLRPPSMIVIEHHQPWRGHLKLFFDSLGASRTRVRLRSTIDGPGVDWLVRRSGLQLPLPPPQNTLRIGLITSKSGSAAVYAMGIEYMAELAVEAANALGGVGGRPLEILVADDATDAGIAGLEARRMAKARCRAIFACTTSASFAAVMNAVQGSDILLVQPVMNEGGVEPANVVRLGERPASQVDALARLLMKTAGGRRWFLVGQSYNWSYGAHESARTVLAKHGAEVVGECFVPLGTRDFSQVIERIQKSGADIVMSSLIGADEVAFHRQRATAGLPGETVMLSLVLDESTYGYIGPDAAQNVWTAQSYFEGADDAGNDRLVAIYRTRYGRFAPPITSLSETVYEAILQYARLLDRDPDASAAVQAQVLRESRGSTRNNTVGERNLTSQRLWLAKADTAAMRIFDVFG
jgi:urea transport system substrate-binding protein